MLVGNSPRRLYSSKKISNKHYEDPPQQFLISPAMCIWGMIQTESNSSLSLESLKGQQTHTCHQATKVTVM
jgi:hypothetical protein